MTAVAVALQWSSGDDQAAVPIGGDDGGAWVGLWPVPVQLGDIARVIELQRPSANAAAMYGLWLQNGRQWPSGPVSPAGALTLWGDVARAAVAAPAYTVTDMQATADQALTALSDVTNAGMAAVLDAIAQIH